MLTVEMLDEALRAVAQLGIKVRNEPLAGHAGGLCEFAGKKWLFLDLTQTPGEQLQLVLQCLREQPQAGQLSLSRELDLLLDLRKSA